MIETTELRLNNDVLYCNETRKVTMIDAVTVQLEDCEGYIATVDIDPIPITPEILLACGFEEAPKNDPFGGYLYEVSNHQKMRLRIIDDAWCWRNFGYDMPYNELHELQNLIYALTGTELNYNPES